MASLIRYKKLSLGDKGRQAEEEEEDEIVEEEETRKRPSTSVNVGADRPGTAHKVSYPLRSKRYLYARWSCGTGIMVTLLVMIVAAIVLIGVAPDCDTPWWKTTVIYQCYPQSFQDSDGDGVGDLNGILQRASYFTDIGVNAVWLNPIFESPQRDAGYDISNYTAIDSRYGTIDTLAQLLEELHKRNVRLLLDFVPNHSSDQHPWFKESRSSLTNPKRDWYIWADGKDGGPPNNWISLFGGSAWQYDNITGQYYLHQFSVFQPDLNYTNPEVRNAIMDVLRFWLDFGVDGFRVDAVAFLLEDPELRNEAVDVSFSSPPGVNCSVNVTNKSCYGSLVHNLTSNLPGIHTIFKEWRNVVNHYSKLGEEKILIGEVYAPLDVVMSYYGTNGDEFTFPFNFFLLTNTEWSGSAVNCIVSQINASLPLGGWPNWVLGNHDNSRIATKAGAYLARALNVLLLTLPGTPTTYYGEEIRMTDVPINASQKKDPYEDRDKERTPMQWNTSAHAGFTYPSSTPWLPVGPSYPTYNVQSENATNSTLVLYKQLVELRSHEAFRSSHYQCINATDEVLVYLRYSSDTAKQFLIIINFSENPETIAITTPFTDATVRLSTSFNRRGTLDLPGNVTVSGGEALVVSVTRNEESCDTLITDLCGMCNSTTTSSSSS